MLSKRAAMLKGSSVKDEVLPLACFLCRDRSHRFVSQQRCAVDKHVSSSRIRRRACPWATPRLSPSFVRRRRRKPSRRFALFSPLDARPPHASPSFAKACLAPLLVVPSACLTVACAAVGDRRCNRLPEAGVPTAISAANTTRGLRDAPPASAAPSAGTEDVHLNAATVRKRKARH